MGLVNGGTIIANQSTPLIIQPNFMGFTNNGTLQVNNGDIMQVKTGPFSNFVGTTLTGGTYNVSGTLEIDQLGNTGGEIVTNAAHIIMNGPTSTFVDSASNDALSNLNTNAVGSGFTIMGGRNFTTAGNFTNNGTLTVGGGGSKFVHTLAARLHSEPETKATVGHGCAVALPDDGRKVRVRERKFALQQPSVIGIGKHQAATEAAAVPATGNVIELQRVSLVGDVGTEIGDRTEDTGPQLFGR